MDDKHFDKTLKDILNNPPPFEPDAQAIANMRDRLDKAMAPRRKRAGVLWWLVPLLTLPFLFSSVFFFYKYKIANKTAYDLKVQLTEFQKDSNTNIEHHTTYFFDTVYNTIYKDVIVERIIEKNIPAENAYAGFLNTSETSQFLKPAAKTGLWSKSGMEPLERLHSKGNSILENLVKSPFASEDVALNDLASVLEINNQIIEKLNEVSPEEQRAKDKLIQRLNGVVAIKPTHSWRKPKVAKAFQDLPKFNQQDYSGEVPPYLYFMPTGFQAGIHYSPFGFAMGLPGSGNSVDNYGISAEIKFLNSVRLKLGVSRLATSFKVYPTDDGFETFPKATPDNPNDNLNELKGQFSYIQIPIQFKYVLRKDKAVRPFFGVGVIARKPINQEFVAEYYTQNDDEYYKSVKVGNSGFDFKNLNTSIGLEYNFWKSFYAVAEGYYHHNFEQPQDAYFKLRYFGLDLGLKYEF